ncbi:transporter substrate-binding domain-containing protein [Oceanicella sp. SM1341]|uniref:transporter substrate-binding domain-containing protein n=1 Tax=Oceanicella sp. SM1341 TaxID=1548889 RepID=UPI000E516A2D|nr:transporter substrate-binding domain-containing protein [Oceanicella sp. SM1341]
MKFRSILAAAAAFATLATVSAQGADDLGLLEPGKLMVATEGTYPPFSMREANGDLDGLEVRVMKEVAKRLGLEYTPVVTKWDSLLVGLMSDQFDVISAAMDITAERQERVTFSDGWLESGGRIVTAEGSDITGLADLKGRTVGALVASNWTTIGEEAGAEVKTYKAESDAMQDLVNGNLDAVITDSIAAAFAIKEGGMPLTMTEDYVSTVQKGFAMQKGKIALAEAINGALADMIADGTYAELTTGLVGYAPAPAEPIRTIKD